MCFFVRQACACRSHGVSPAVRPVRCAPGRGRPAVRAWTGRPVRFGHCKSTGGTSRTPGERTECGRRVRVSLAWRVAGGPARTLRSRAWTSRRTGMDRVPGPVRALQKYGRHVSDARRAAGVRESLAWRVAGGPACPRRSTMACCWAAQTTLRHKPRGFVKPCCRAKIV